MKKSYKMQKPTWLTVAVCCSALALIIGAAANAWRLTFWQDLTVQNRIIVPILCVAFSLLAVIAITFAFFARYTVTGSVLSVWYGTWRCKLNVLAVTEAVQYQKSKRLALFFGEEYFLIAISETQFSEFLDDLRAGGGTFTCSIDYEDGLQ